MEESDSDAAEPASHKCDGCCHGLQIRKVYGAIMVATLAPTTRRHLQAWLATTLLAWSRAVAAADLAEQVRAILPDTPGACVLAIDGGEVVFQHAYGVAEVGSPTPCTLDSCFRLASVSKQFTAAAIMRLVERDKVALDDPLQKYFPEFPAWGQAITVRQLLIHKSGLPDYEDLIPAGTTLQLDDLDVLHLLLDAKGPKFPPGSEWSYSNSGYTLLGLIVDIAAAKPFHDFVADELFRPAEMEDAVLYVRGLHKIPHRALGHVREGDRWVVGDHSVTSAVRGDGGVYCSANDYRRWLTALDQKRILSAASYEQIFRPQARAWDETHYGFGWFLDEYRGQPRAYHNGETRGFSHTVQRFPRRRGAVVLLMNSVPSTPTTELGEQLADRLIFDRTSAGSP